MRAALFFIASLVILTQIPVTAGAQGVPAPSTTAQVRVTLTNGTRLTGKLVSLTVTELVVLQRKTARETRYKLSEVKLVETVQHNARNLALIGGAVGFGLALAGDWCGSGEPYGSPGEPACLTAKPALVVAAVAALGAAIGYGLDKNRTKILFAGPAGTTVSIHPLAIRRGVWVGMSIDW